MQFATRGGCADTDITVVLNDHAMRMPRSSIRGGVKIQPGRRVADTRCTINGGNDRSAICIGATIIRLEINMSDFIIVLDNGFASFGTARPAESNVAAASVSARISERFDE